MGGGTLTILAGSRAVCGTRRLRQRECGGLAKSPGTDVYELIEMMRVEFVP
jgi:hypothetical protein